MASWKWPEKTADELQARRQVRARVSVMAEVRMRVISCKHDVVDPVSNPDPEREPDSV